MAGCACLPQHLGVSCRLSKRCRPWPWRLRWVPMSGTLSSPRFRDSISRLRPAKAQAGDVGDGNHPGMDKRAISIPRDLHSAGRVFMFAGLLKVMQASIPGGSAGALILASRNFGWGLEPGVLLGMTTAAAGLVLAYLAKRLLDDGLWERRWVRAVVLGTCAAFTALMTVRAKGHARRVAQEAERRLARATTQLEAQRAGARRNPQVLEIPDGAWESFDSQAMPNKLPPTGVNRSALEAIRRAQRGA